MIPLYAMLIIVSTSITIQTIRYDGHQVLRLFPSSSEQAKRIKELVNRYGLGVWDSEPTDKSVDIHVQPEILPLFKNDIKQLQIPYTRWINDIQSLIEQQQSDSKVKDRDLENSVYDSGEFAFSKYNTFEMITSFLLNLTKNIHFGPSGDQIIVSHQVIGHTFEGNQLHLLKIFKDGPVKKAIFIEGGIHAREWISPAVVVYLTNELVNNPTRSPVIEDFVDSYDWYIVPVLNPDGYIYSHTNDRLWRKNRRILENSHDTNFVRIVGSPSNNKDSCSIGVDVNRNFGYMWDPNNGGSAMPCSESYSGPYAFSELESKAIKTVIEDENVNFISYVSFHSYGQRWLYPWAYTSEYTQDVADLDTGAQLVRAAMRQRYNTDFLVDSVYNSLYPASGISIDYTKGIAGIKYSYTCELRDKNHYGFLLPENKIIPSCEETMDGINALISFLKTAP